MNCNDFITDFLKKRVRPPAPVQPRQVAGDDFEAYYIDNYVLPCLDGINPRDRGKHYIICGIGDYPDNPERFHGRVHEAIWASLERRYGPIDPHDFGLFSQQKWLTQDIALALVIDDRPTALILDISVHRILDYLFNIRMDEGSHGLFDRTEIIVVPTLLRAIVESPEFAALKAVNESPDFTELRSLIAKFEADFGPIEDRDEDAVESDAVDPSHVVIGRRLGVTAIPKKGRADAATGGILLPVARARRMITILDGLIRRSEYLQKSSAGNAGREGIPEIPFGTNDETRLLEAFLTLRNAMPVGADQAYDEFCGNAAFDLDAYRSIIGNGTYLMEAQNQITESLGNFQLLRDRARNAPSSRGRHQEAVLGFDKVADLPALGAARSRLIRLARRLRRVGTGATTGILLAGPPGTGKSLIARVIAAESGRAVFAETLARVSAGAKYDEVIRKLTEIFAAAKKVAPAVVIIDEMDTFIERSMMHSDNAAWNTGIVNIVLDLFSGFRGDVAIIGTTNHPHMIDRALLRPGRLGERIDIDLPNAEGINELLRHYLPHMTEDQIKGAMLLMPQRPSQAAVAAMAEEARAQIEDELAAAEEAEAAMKPDVAAGAAPSWRHVEAAITQMQGARRRQTPGLA